MSQLKHIARSQGDSRLVGLAAAVVVIAALYFARVVLIPLALAILLSLLLTPVVAFLEHRQLPRFLAISLIAVALIVLVIFVVRQASPQFVDLTNNLPTYEKAVGNKIRVLKSSMDQKLDKASSSLIVLEKQIAIPPSTPTFGGPSKTDNSRGSSLSHPLTVEMVPPSSFLGPMQSVIAPFVMVGLVAIFTIFILFGREDLRNRFIRLVYRGRLHAMTQAMDEAMHRINRYLLLQFVVNTTDGIVIAVVLHFIGIPDAALWGLVAAVLRFLPYVGAPLAALMPIVLALALFPGWSHALMTAGFYLLLEIIVANVIEPLLYGAHVGLSPLAILVAAVFWTLIWGFPGLILSTPLTVCLVVMGRYVPSLNFLDVLLGNAVVLPPHVQYYQRLLAGDQVEAKQIVESYLKENSAESLYASVLIPALRLAEQDRHRGELDRESKQLIYQSGREIIEEIPEWSAKSPRTFAASAAQPDLSGNIDVLCIPARDEGDEVVAVLLAQMLQAQGHRSHSLPTGKSLEMLAHVKKIRPASVCISSLPPFATTHARDLYGKLRLQEPELPIVVCIWHSDIDPQRAAARLRLAPHHFLYTTLPEVLRHFAVRNKLESKPAEARGQTYFKKRRSRAV
jgi:predicted PurR-regulated permease PerM